MAMVAISHNSFHSEEVDSFSTHTRVSPTSTHDISALDLASEADVAARLLCALSTHTSLREAMLSYHAELPEPTALSWTDQVLRRMEAMMHEATTADVNSTYSYTRPWINPAETVPGQPSLLTRLALPAVMAAGGIMFAMCVVGLVTTYHYVLAR